VTTKHDHRAKVQALRADIEKLKAERQRVLDLPCDEATAVGRIDQHIADLAGQYRPRAAHYLMPAAEYEQPDLVGVGRTVSGLIQLDAVMIAFAYYSPDLLRSKLVAEAKAVAAAERGIAEPERTATVRRIDERIVEAEVAEERLILAAAAAGDHIPRRADLSVTAWLSA